MKYLIIGSGGREHAIAWKLSNEKDCEKVYVSPGNAGTELEEKCENIHFPSDEDMIEFCEREKIDITIVGPEKPLVDGLVDRFKDKGLGIIGPHKEAARLEGSKGFAKDFMMRNNIRTAGYKTFNTFEEAVEFIDDGKYPLVVKADGLAAGKGVTICTTREEALRALEESMLDGRFGDGGKRVVIEECLTGVEASIIGLYDGERFQEFISCKDHKKIFEGETGPNTGGMGIVSPNPYLNKEIMEDFRDNILEPTIRGLKEENLQFKGFIFFGVMIEDGKCYLLEYNLRMGDPETQAIMSLMESDLSETLNDCLQGKMIEAKLQWKKKNCCSVVLASGGYPSEIKTGYPIDIEHKNMKGSKVFFAGAQIGSKGIETSGGRVACVTTLADELKEAREITYREIENINFNGMQFRKDI